MIWEIANISVTTAALDYQFMIQIMLWPSNGPRQDSRVGLTIFILNQYDWELTTMGPKKYRLTISESQTSKSTLIVWNHDKIIVVSTMDAVSNYGVASWSHCNWHN